MEITKGKWEVKGNLCVISESVEPTTNTVCQLFEDSEENTNNAILIADAGNTYQSTNKLPSELAEANKELLEALKATNQLNLHLYKDGTIGNEVYKEIQAAIKKHIHA